MSIYVDFHVLQTVPPSCVNRDDTGSPKTAVYGGTTRARVSSQAWKRAIRTMFQEELLSQEMVGTRTKKIVAMVANEIAWLYPSNIMCILYFYFPQVHLIKYFSCIICSHFWGYKDKYE